MKIKAVTVGLLLLALLANSIPAAARQAGGASGEWASVKALVAGDKLRVQLKDGKKVEGKLRGVTDEILTLERGGKTNDLSRESIARVYLFRGSAGSSVGKAAAIGAGVGAGVGVGVGVASGGFEDISRGEVAAVLGAVGAGLGAGIGALVGAFGSKRKQVLIYESR